MATTQWRTLAESLVEVAGKRIGDPSLPARLLQVEDGRQVRRRNHALVSQAAIGISATISLINDAADRDDDGIVASQAASTDDRAASRWRPQLRAGPGRGWIKIALEIDAAAVLSAGSPTLATLRADGALRLLSYHAHGAEEPVVSAVADDALAFASLLDLDDVLALGVHEAAALQVRSTLGATLTVSQAEVFALALREVDAVSGPGATGVLEMEIDADAAVRFSVLLQDEFMLCLSREAPDGEAAFRLVLRRAARNHRRLAGKAGITVGFADPDALRETVAGALSAVLDAPARALAAIAQASSLEALPAAHREIAVRLLERLGLVPIAPLEALKDRLSALDARLNDRLDTWLRARIRIGLEVEYTRLSERASVAEASLSTAALRRLHAALLRLDIDALQDDPGADLQFFLDEQVREHGRKLGFSLHLGGWLSLSARQERHARFTSRHYQSGAVERSSHHWLASAGYTARINTWSTAHGASMEANLADADPGVPVLARRFDTRLELWWQESNLRCATALPRIVDDAVLWGVIESSSAEALHRRLATALAHSRDCRTRLQMTLEDPALRAASRSIGGFATARWARHAARALPWWARAPSRASCASREAAYAPFFHAYDGAKVATPAALRRLIAEHCRGDGAWLAQERLGQRPWTLYQVLLRSHVGQRRFWTRWEALRAGFENLATLLDGDADWAGFDAPFADMMPTFEQAYLVRATASLLASLPTSTDAHATLTVGFEVAGKNRSLVVNRRLARE